MHDKAITFMMLHRNRIFSSYSRRTNKTAVFKQLVVVNKHLCLYNVNKKNLKRTIVVAASFLPAFLPALQ